MEECDPKLIRKRFLSELASPSELTGIFEHLGDISVFAKNRKYQLTYGNQHFFQRFGFTNDSQFVGKTDFQLYPAPLAEKFRTDDEQVFSTGLPLLNIVELFLNQQGIPDWFITQKVPLFGSDGKVIGLMGAIRRYQNQGIDTFGESPLARATNAFKSNLGRRWNMRDVARDVGLSQRQFNRRFRETFGITPQSYLMKTRIQAACNELRKPNSEISEVALRLGFYRSSRWRVCSSRRARRTRRPAASPTSAAACPRATVPRPRSTST